MALTSDLAAVVFGLASAAAWGAGDFSGGQASRRIHTVVVVAASQAVGLVLMVALAIASAETLPSGATLVWGALAGIAGCVGLLALYQALTVAHAGLVAPISGVITALVPMGFGLLTEGLPGASKLVGFGLALVSVWLASGSRGAGKGRTGLGLALVAGLGFGTFLILIDQAGKSSTFWSLAAARSASVTLTGLVVLSNRRKAETNNRLLVWVLLAGILDVAGNSFFVLATQSGRLDIASVLSSLYPAMTVLLARLVLKERVTGWQMVGVGAALAAIVLIAA